jgi:hypothetical protein
VSFFLSQQSWYLLTSRRVLGSYSGLSVEVAALDIVKDDFVDPKGHNGSEIEVVTCWSANGSKAVLQYETGRASMAPIHYFRYWKLKYPILDKLRG